MSKKRKKTMLRFRIPAKDIKGKGIIASQPFLVKDLGDSDFPVPNPNTIVRTAELMLAGLKRPKRDRDTETREEMRNRTTAMRKPYQQSLARAYAKTYGGLTTKS